MRKRNKRKLSAFEALAIANSKPVEKITVGDTHSRYSASGLREYQREYEQEQEAPLRAAKNEHARLLQQMIENDSPVLYSAPSTFLAATAPSLDASRFNGVDPQIIRASLRKAFEEFESQIASEGKITSDGRKKLQRIAMANPDIDFTQSQSFYQAFLLAYHAGEMTDQGDSETPDFIVQEIAEPEPTFAEKLEGIDLSDRKGNALARKLADHDYFGREGAQMMLLWEQHLAKDYRVILDDTQKRAVVAWLMKWNRNPLRHECWNEARRALGKAGIIPLMLTEDEKLAESLESANLNDFAARRRYANESRRIIGG